MTHCKPAESQLPGKKETEELQAGVHVKTAHSSDSKEGSRGNVIPKKATVLIMVAPPTDLQQVGQGRWPHSLVPLAVIYCRVRPA